METARKLLEEGKPLEALDRLKKFLPTAEEEWRVHELIGAAFHDLADAEGAAQAYFNAAITDRFLRSQRAHFSNYLFALHYLPQLDAAALIHELKIYNSLYRDTETLPQKNFSAEKISVAFLAPNFCDSSSARFYESLLTDYDREKFFVTAWSMSKEEDAFTKKIRRSVDGFFEIAEVSFEEAAEKIRAAGTEILIDLGGHTEGGSTLQIVAYRPARIQMTGLEAINYFHTAHEKISRKKISVAFIAPNFCDSSSARFYESLLTDYDREKFFVTAWSMSKEEDAFTKKIRRSVDGFFEIAEVSFEEAAEKIRAAGTEILIDLGGHTEGGSTLQIAAYRPARVQLCGIGYFDSTGLDAIDYFIGDEFLTAHDETFSEKIFALKNAFAFRPNARMILERKSLRPFPHKNFTFGSLNNFMKLSDDYLSAVKKILDAVPDAKIIFRDTTPLASRQIALRERLKNFGIERAEIRRGSDNFFTDYSEIDLILDAFPYAGGMMTALALYMGVPVLNLCGSLAFSRTGADILHIAALDEMIVTDADAYIKKAVDLSANPSRLAALTEKISFDKLLDTKTFVEDFYGRLEAI